MYLNNKAINGNSTNNQVIAAATGEHKKHICKGLHKHDSTIVHICTYTHPIPHLKQNILTYNHTHNHTQLDTKIDLQICHAR